MGTDNRANILKEAVSLLLKNLVNYDWVGIVIFASEATTYNKILVRATSANIDKMIKFVNGNDPNGGTNYQAAFQAADNLLTNSIYDENNSPCKTFVMFLTDGIPTAGLKEEEQLTTFIDGLMSLKKAIIFSYSLGANASSSIPKAISCMRNGIFEMVSNVGDLSIKLNSYFVILSLGMKIEKAIWVEPYTDFSGLGELTTCSIPVYDRSVNPYILLGVIGIDISLYDMMVIEPDVTVITKKLISKSMSACTNSDATECQINTLRSDQFKCSEHNGNCKTACNSFQIPGVNSAQKFPLWSMR